MKPRPLALLGAFFLTAWIALPVLAVAPPGKVTVDANGCSFAVHIDLDKAYDLVGWKVKEYNAVNWNEGTTLFKGSGPTDADGKIDITGLSAPEGHYTVAVDDEYPPDGSSIVIDFFLSCPAASQQPSSAPSTVPSSAPSTAPSEAPISSDAPSGSELPAQVSSQPSGNVGGIAGTPAGVTPPPTDASAPTGSATDGGWQVVVVMITAVALAVGLLYPRPFRSAAAATVGRRR
jgi:hypothetical protein